MSAGDGGGLIDWGRTARRLRRILTGLALLVLLAFGLLSGVRGEVRPSLLAELVGLALLVAFAVEVVVVGGSALRGMLTAGERGERLASADVGLLPPQVLRRAQGLPGCGPDGCAVPSHEHGMEEPRRHG
ncbi:MAG: hypothetical protein ACNA8R_00435 [Nitriliruptoraceae bacterium]